MAEAPMRLPDPTLLREETVTIRGFGLHLRIWGDLSKPMVVLQHGGKDHGRSWDWTVAALVDDYCCAVPDSRGHGDSDWSRSGSYDTFDHVKDMSAVIDHLIDLGAKPPFHLIGHSFGGNIVLNYTAAQPERVRSLMSIEGLGFSQKTYDDIMAKPFSERMANVLDHRRKALERGPRVFKSQEEGIKRMKSLHTQLSEEQATHLARHALREVDGGYRWKHDPLLGAMPVRPVPPSEYGEAFGTITAPIFMMYGSESWASNPDADGRLDAFQNVEFKLFEGAGHWLHHDQFHDFIGLTRRFLEAHT